MAAGVIYENFNGKTVWMHVAGKGANWLTRKFLHAVFDYPFNQMGLPAVRAYVEASNQRSVKFCRHVGFNPEAMLYGAASDGGDVHLFVMRREWCRYA